VRRGLPWFLLILSAALNLFFIVGALSTGAFLGGGQTEPVRERTVEHLGLDDAQRAALDGLAERTSERRETMRANRAEPRQAILDAVAAPAFERELVTSLLEVNNQERDAFLLETYADLHGFVATLDADQRARFLEMAQDSGFLRRLLSDPKERQ